MRNYQKEVIKLFDSQDKIMSLNLSPVVLVEQIGKTLDNWADNPFGRP